MRSEGKRTRCPTLPFREHKTLVSMVYFSDTPVLWCHAVIKDECKKRKQHENIVNRGLIMCTHGPGCGEGTGG